MVRLLPVLVLLACTTSVDGTDPVSPPGTPYVPAVTPTPPPVTSAARLAPPVNTDVFSARTPYSTTTLVQDSTGNTVYAVDTDNGTVVSMNTTTGVSATLSVGSEPSRIARAGDELLVTLRADRSIVRISTADFSITGTQHVGAEPVGIVGRSDNQRVYVAVSQQNEVLELDGSTLEILARIPVPGEPRYLALAPDGQTLFVGSGRGEARLTQIDLVSLVSNRIALPETARVDFFTGIDSPMVARLTGDFGLLENAEGAIRLAVPVLYADILTPVPDISDPADIEPPDPNGDPFLEEGGGYGGGAGGGLGRLNPTVVEIGIVSGQATAGIPMLVDVPTDDFSAADVFGFPRSVRSYVSSVSYVPGERLLATLEASEAAVLLAPASISFTDAFNSAEEGGLVSPAAVALEAGNGVNGALWTGPSTAFALNAFDHSFSRLDVASGSAILDDAVAQSFNDFVPVTSSLGTEVFATSPLGAEERLGRSLFYSASNESMGAGGVSCSTCHFEGRNDGLTWTFDGGLRQTKSLAGVVSETAPVTWTSNVASVAMEADITTRGRMGGSGLIPEQLSAIAAFVDSTRLPDAPDILDADAVSRGAVVFAQTGCSTCHSGAAYTDNVDHTVRDVSLNTPRLVGVAGSAPYLFDGSAPTLRDVLELARDPGNMGSTATLSTAELDDLEAYLLTL